MDLSQVRFVRSATRHRVSREAIRHVLLHHVVYFEQPPPSGSVESHSLRHVYMGEDAGGRAIEVMAVRRPDGTLLVIHAMALRGKYRGRYEEGNQ